MVQYQKLITRKMKTIKICFNNNTIKKIELKKIFKDQLCEIKCNIKEIYYKDNDNDMITINTQSDWNIFLTDQSMIYSDKIQNDHIGNPVIEFSEPVVEKIEPVVEKIEPVVENMTIEDLNKIDYSDAIKDNHINYIKDMMSKGINLFTIDYIKCINTHEMCELIIYFGTEKTYTLSFLKACLCKCIELCYLGGIKTIFRKFEKTIDINEIILSTVDMLNACNVIIYACKQTISQEQTIKILELLLKLGANINITDNNRDTTLHWAVYKNLPKVVKFLLKNCADDNIKNDNQTYAKNEKSSNYHGNNGYDEIDRIFNLHEAEKLCKKLGLDKDQCDALAAFLTKKMK